MLACMLSFQSRPTLCDPTDYSPPGSPSMGSSRQEYWSGLPCPPQEKLHCYCEIKWKEGKKKEKEKWYERGREGKLEIHLFFFKPFIGYFNLSASSDRMVAFIYSTIYSTKDKETNRWQQIFTQPKQTKRWTKSLFKHKFLPGHWT